MIHIWYSAVASEEIFFFCSRTECSFLVPFSMIKKGFIQKYESSDSWLWRSGMPWWCPEWWKFWISCAPCWPRYWLGLDEVDDDTLQLLFINMEALPLWKVNGHDYDKDMRKVFFFFYKSSIFLITNFSRRYRSSC